LLLSILILLLEASKFVFHDFHRTVKLVLYGFHNRFLDQSYIFSVTLDCFCVDTEVSGGLLLELLEIFIFAIRAHFCDNRRYLRLKSSILQVFVKFDYDLLYLLKLLRELTHILLHRFARGKHQIMKLVIVFVKSEPLKMSFDS